MKLKDIINEGVYDPGIFKAIFLAGGPGSGKSFVANELVGIPKGADIDLSAFTNISQTTPANYLGTNEDGTPITLQSTIEANQEETGE